MKKKMVVYSLFVFTFGLTGCLEELLSILCDQLAGSNSITIIYETDPNIYSDMQARITYINASDASELEVSECAEGFIFPNGQKKSFPEVSVPNMVFITILDGVKSPFFFDGTVAKTDLFSSRIDFFLNCTDLEGNSNLQASIQSSAPESLNWQQAVELPEEVALIGDCQIDGRSAVVTLSDSLN